MELVEVLGFVSGAVCVWLAVRENLWTFPVGLANNVLFLALFASSGLYANAALQVAYLVLGALGWWWWLRGGTAGRALVVRRTPRWAWPVAGATSLLLTVLLTAALSRWTDSTVPFMDALTTALSLVAQTMLGRKWLGNWAVWVLADVLLVQLYAGQELWLTAVLYAGFIGLCFAGLRRWLAVLRVGAAPAAAGVPAVVR